MQNADGASWKMKNNDEGEQLWKKEKGIIGKGAKTPQKRIFLTVSPVIILGKKYS